MLMWEDVYVKQDVIKTIVYVERVKPVVHLCAHVNNVKIKSLNWIGRPLDKITKKGAEKRQR